MGKQFLLGEALTPEVMHVTYFSEYALPCQGLASRGLRRPAVFNRTPSGAAAPRPGRTMDLPQRPVTPTGQDRNYLLDQQQAIYDELVAGHSRGLESPPMAPLNRLPLTAAEITRDLAGWTSSLSGRGHQQ